MQILRYILVVLETGAGAPHSFNLMLYRFEEGYDSVPLG